MQQAFDSVFFNLLEGFSHDLDSVSIPASVEQRVEGADVPDTKERLVYGRRAFEAFCKLIWQSQIGNAQSGSDPTPCVAKYCFWGNTGSPNRSLALTSGR